ncbi:MAG: amidohydrolase [Chloroflexi bacterium]|nr:amidohydrolase [Chloroflexota bacterium]
MGEPQESQDRQMLLSLREEIQASRDEMVSIRRDLHARPELAFQEKYTSRLISGRLESLGLKVQTGIARTGVVGLAEGRLEGPTLMLRADMDALPVQETSDKPYRSKSNGVMHACGHDGHMAVLLAVAAVLAGHRERLKGTAKLVFQPAEETMSGARDMMAEGVMENPRVDRALGFHLWNALPVGHVGVRPGVIFASADEFRLVIRGQGGHGALPHQAVDPVPMAAQVITALQTLVSRERPPGEVAVLTIGTIQGGTAYNVIADQVEMGGTLRTFNQDLRQVLLGRIPEVAGGVCAALRGTFEFDVVRGCPPVYNDPKVARFVRHVASQVVGEENLPDVVPSTVADDIALFLMEAPGCYFLVGSSNPGKGLDSPHHSPSFDFDEDALSIAAEILLRSALEYLG